MSSRETIEPHTGDKRYVRRNQQRQFAEKQVSVGKGLTADRRTKAKTTVPEDQGDRGDEKRS